MSKLFTYTVGEKLMLNTRKYDLKKHNGELVQIVDLKETGSLDYCIQLENNEFTSVKENELQPLKKEYQSMGFKRGEVVLFTPKNEVGVIQKLDWLHGQVEILLGDNSYVVVGLEKLRKIDKESVQDEKAKEVVKVDSQRKNVSNRIVDLLLNQYKNQDGTYTLPNDVVHKLIEYSVGE
jgi:hypothetical protein